MVVNCILCGVEFIKNRPMHIYCSAKCKQTARNMRRKQETEFNGIKTTLNCIDYYKHKKQRILSNKIYRSNNKESIKNKKKVYYEKTKSLKKIYDKQRWESIKNNPDEYYKRLTRIRVGIPLRQITSELSETYKNFLQLKKEIKNVKINSK